MMGLGVYLLLVYKRHGKRANIWAKYAGLSRVNVVALSRLYQSKTCIFPQR